MVGLRRRAFVSSVCAAVLAVFAASAAAQSTIAGTVRDPSGAVLPGATVEVTSPALIEGSRTAVTNEGGQYRIIDLRPGNYTVTFSLTGFNTVKRELELSANFTATIDSQLNVGAVEESVLVSGASPVVDVQTNVKQQVMSRDVLDAVPTARTMQSMGQLVLGVTLDAPDVGGSRAMQQTYFQTRGNGSAQTIVMVDGLIMNGLQGDGAVLGYPNEAIVQEAVYQTAGGNAETVTGGLNMNLVPKDGGNMFSGGAKFTKSPKSWQGDNLSDRLRNFRIGSVDQIENFYEWNVEQGGPLVRNKVWFFAAFRQARYDKPVANVFVLPDGVAPGQAFVQCRDNPGSCAPGISDEHVNNPVLRLTWQVSERNKLAAYMDHAFRYRGHSMTASTDPDTASVRWHSPVYATGSVKYTSTLSPSLLLETGVSFNRERYDNVYQEGIKADRGTADWYRNVRKQDISTGFAWNASTAELLNYPDRYNVQASLSYVSGAHAIKVGFLEAWGKYFRSYDANADLYQRYNNGVPTQVLVLNTPIRIQEDMSSNRGIFAQDSWRLEKLTLNYGVRFDHIEQRIAGQPAQVGRFANLPAYDGFGLPTWNTWSPRLAAVYDLFGTGKTAVRAGFNKFVASMSTGLAQLYSPSSLQNTTVLPWNDVNGDDIAQGERGCVFGSPGCEINFANLPANFGVRALNRPDPDRALERPYQWSTNVGVSHEVMPGVSMAFEWYRNDFRAMTERNNAARTFDSYTPVDVVSPLDGSVIRVFDVLPQFSREVNNFDSTDHDLKRVYHGFDLSGNARIVGGMRAFGGFNLERTRTNTCTAGTDPNFQQYCDQATYDIPWRKQFKLTVLYPLPWYGVSVSAAWQSLNGYLLGTAAQQFGPFTAGTGFDRPNGIGTFYRVTPTTRYAADCTGPCRPNELVIPNMQSAEIQVPLTAANTEFTPRVNQVDFSVSKSFRFGRVTALPKLDIFNALNSDDYTAVETLQFGADAYQRPSVILQGRIVRVGVDMRW